MLATKHIARKFYPDPDCNYRPADTVGQSAPMLGRRPALGQPGALLLSWVPILGDPLCVAAGWLRLNAGWSVLFIAPGKFARY